jgi:hypothetical protein
MGSTADDHRVNGGATPATAVVSTTLCKRGMMAKKMRRRATSGKWPGTSGGGPYGCVWPREVGTLCGRAFRKRGPWVGGT